MKPFYPSSETVLPFKRNVCRYAEAAHRSTFYFPYWDIPFMTDIVPRQREFKKNIGIINDTLNGLIRKAQKFEGTEDLEELQNRDYSKVNDPSLLRFLVDIRGADVTDLQLRDDLMTMLIAGHETTAAVLTWWGAVQGQIK